MSKIAGAQGNIFEDAKNWPPIGSASLSGYERSRVLLNRGQAGFVDVAQEAGVTDRLDGRAVAMADLFNRGVLDVIIANEKGRVLLYKNTFPLSRRERGAGGEDSRRERGPGGEGSGRDRGRSQVPDRLSHHAGARGRRSALRHPRRLPAPRDHTGRLCGD